HIGIDEKGVEAAAFTRIDVSGAANVEPPHVEMTLDRPFLYAVTAANGALLFIGVVGNPAA
ncbi:MAG: serpin family protein, partial [bacterium]|nr:serpin family protein [bacterium]